MIGRLDKGAIIAGSPPTPPTCRVGWPANYGATH